MGKKGGAFGVSPSPKYKGIHHSCLPSFIFAQYFVLTCCVMTMLTISGVHGHFLIVLYFRIIFIYILWSTFQLFRCTVECHPIKEKFSLSPISIMKFGFTLFYYWGFFSNFQNICNETWKIYDIASVTKSYGYITISLSTLFPDQI